jgi:hypothetical protein
VAQEKERVGSVYPENKPEYFARVLQHPFQ